MKKGIYYKYMNEFKDNKYKIVKNAISKELTMKSYLPSILVSRNVCF